MLVRPLVCDVPDELPWFTFTPYDRLLSTPSVLDRLVCAYVEPLVSRLKLVESVIGRALPSGIDNLNVCILGRIFLIFGIPVNGTETKEAYIYLVQVLKMTYWVGIGRPA